MTFTSISNPSSIFEGGKLKPGFYKIQNLYTEGYVDIYEHSKEMFCRPAQDLGEGRGIVRPNLFRLCFVPQYQKWEIKPLGIGYTIQRVSPPMAFATVSATVC